MNAQRTKHTFDYKEVSLEPLPKKLRQKITTIPIQPPYDTHWSITKQKKNVLRGEFEFLCLRIHAFELDHVERKKMLICDILTNQGIGLQKAIYIEDVREEEWIGAIKGKEYELVQLGFVTRAYINRMAYQNLDIKFPVGETVYQSPIDENGRLKLDCAIKGKIKQVDLNSYRGQLEPEYLFEADTFLSAGINANGWCYRVQLSQIDTTLRNVSVDDIITDGIRKSVETGSMAYMSSSFISSADLPVDLDMRSTFFGKPAVLAQYERDALMTHTQPKAIIYKYLKHTLETAFENRVLPLTGTTSKLEVLRLTPQNVLSFGVYIDEVSMTSMINHLVADNVQVLNEMKYIVLTLPIAFVIEQLQMNRVIKTYRDRATATLQTAVTVNYVRKASSICVSKFTFKHANRVQNENM